MLNTAVAESLSLFYEELKDVAPEKMDEAVHKLVKAVSDFRKANPDYDLTDYLGLFSFRIYQWHHFLPSFLPVYYVVSGS